MVGLESTLEQTETAKKFKKPEIAETERERQQKFLAQLRSRKPVKIKAVKPVKAKAKAKPKKGKRMTRATKVRRTTVRFAAVKSCAQPTVKVRLSAVMK